MSKEPMFSNPKLLAQKQLMEKLDCTQTQVRRDVGDNYLRFTEDLFSLEHLCKVSDAYGVTPVLFDNNIEHYSGLNQAVEYVGDTLHMDVDPKTRIQQIENQAWKQHRSIDYLADQNPTFEEPPIPDRLSWLSDVHSIPCVGYVLPNNVDGVRGFCTLSRKHERIYKAYLRGERDFD